jgi:hypothetical protein
MDFTIDRVFVGPPWPGTLNYAGTSSYGLQVELSRVRCNACGTEFPLIKGTIRCNGQVIEECPWCRPGSMLWTAGRGT